jgi:hypothetical protein
VRLSLSCAVAGALVGAAVFAGLAGAETITRGQVGADTACTTPGDFVVAQTGVSGGTSYTIPAGNWTITSWSAQGGSGGQEALVVFRPSGTPNEYTVVASAGPRSLAAGLNTFNANIKVKGGDLIGLWVPAGTVCPRHRLERRHSGRLLPDRTPR